MITLNSFAIMHNYAETKLFHNKIQSKQNMPNDYIYDTISFKGVYGKKMLNYYKNVMKNYIPDSKEEKDFSEAMLKFLNTDVKSNTFEESSQNFLYSYLSIESAFLNNVDNSYDKLKYVFSTLLEGLDNSNTVEHSKQFTKIIFDDFMEAYSDVPVIQEDIKYYLNSSLLKRPIIKDLLEDY